MNLPKMKNWIEFLDLSVREFPHKTAVQHSASGKKLSYLQLQEEVQKWALLLQQKNVRSGDRIAYLSTNSLEHISLLLACAEVGAIFTPINFRLAPQEVIENLHRMNPKIFFTQGEWQIGTHFQHPYLQLRIEDIHLEEFDLRKSRPIRFEGGLEAPVLMLFTSGSSGLPKGVLLHGEMLLTNQIMTCECWGLSPKDITLVESPFFHTGGYNVLCLPLLSLGGTVLIAEKFDTEKTLRTLEQEKVSVYFAVPTMFQMLKEHSSFMDRDFSSIRFFVTGGAACPVELIKTYQDRGLLFKQGFGLTEVGPNCFLLSAEDSVRKAGTIGQPMPHTEVKLLTEDGRSAGLNEVGELLLKGRHICAGYFQENDLFEKALDKGYFMTGDLAYRDEDGFFSIVGRKKEMFISGGENVYPAEVERAINTHPDVLASAVVSKPHAKWGEVGVAFIRSQRKISIDEMKEFLQTRLSKYKQPHEVICLDQFPLLASGKVNKAVLTEQARD